MRKVIIISIFVSLISCQYHPSVHSEQAENFRKNDIPPADKVAVLNGLDVLLDKYPERLEGKNIALVTNNSGIDKMGNTNFQRLMEIDGCSLKIIFSPEHGLFGEAAAGEKVKYGKNLKELPEVISLYGKIRKPTPEMLEGVNLILYDIQDIGARFYTYISTMGLIMEAGAELGIPIWVLDRPNPIRCDIAEGPLMDMKNQSFVGYYPIPIRYGLTAGELARMIVGEKWIESIPKLDVLAVDGWNSDIWYDETDLPWVKPSPNIPDLETAIIYPGMCLIEGTNVSEGRGTYQPFRKFGAPWIDAGELAKHMNNLRLPGAVFKPIRFTPVSIKGMSGKPKHQDVECQGLEIILTDRARYNSLNTGIQLLTALQELYPDDFVIKSKSQSRLFGNDYLVPMVREGKSAEDIIARFEDDKTGFLAKAEKYRLYLPSVSK